MKTDQYYVWKEKCYFIEQPHSCVKSIKVTILK